MTDTNNRPPLWRVMSDAYCQAFNTAAEIRAVRDWLKRELPEGGAWYVLLTAEAERAGRGE